MKKSLLIFLILCSIHFWGYLPIWWYKDYIDLISLLIIGISFIIKLQDKTLRFRNAIFLYLFGIVLNILSAYFNNGQGIKDTTLTFGYYYFILLYFVLHDYKLSRNEIETMILVFAGIYSVFYLIQISAFPTRIFYGNMFYDRGTVRLRMEGAGFLMLAYFMMLNRYLLKRNIFHIIIAMIFLLILLKGGFRTFLAVAVLLSGVVFIKLVKYSPSNYFLIVLAVVVIIGALQMEGPSTIIHNMIETTEQQKEQGERYIRKKQYEFFTKEYPENWTYYVVGGGLGGGTGSYADRMGYMVQEYGFYWVDLGLLGFYLVVGGVTMLGLLWWVFRVMFMKFPPDRLYLNVYMAYLFFVSLLTTPEIYDMGIFGVHAVVLYLADLARDEMKENKQSESLMLQYTV